ncbi:hypothetical protein SAMN05428961_101240 [Paenibacillus sp. OK060]|nr:hypothetical protein SAMN05428961_101240 [Paenibacillus sp. OK060]
MAVLLLVNGVMVPNKDNKKKLSFESFFFMGEEKPDEELMGKRKSSPRLSTTLVMSIIKGWPESFLFIHIRQQFS